MDQPGGNFRRLLESAQELRDLSAAQAVLLWDQQVYLPSGAAGGRAAQIDTLTAVIHAKRTAPDLLKWIEAVERENPPPDSFAARLAALLRRDYEKSVKLPAVFVKALSAACSQAFDSWLRAREANDFSILQPDLVRMVELKREEAGYFPEAQHPLDPLLDDYEEGLTAAELDRVFGGLRGKLTQLVRELGEQAQEDDGFLHQCYPHDAQWELSQEIAQAVGYDFNRGRLDLSEHPFTTGFGLSDVRITTRIIPEQPLSALLGTVHEAGHAMYEQGIDQEYDRTPLADGASLAFHESQSRLWENQVARSRPFWQWFLPRMRERFPAQLAGVDAERIYRAVNRVRPSMIRTEADEVTYNLHIILRYELEKSLLEGRIQVADLPELWNAKMREFLGITPKSDLEGVLQDVHWPTGAFGYFPTYALGNMIAAQVWELARQQVSGLDADLARGEFGALREFLRENLQRYGALLPPLQLLKKLTGRDCYDAAPFLRYLADKYPIR